MKSRLSLAVLALALAPLAAPLLAATHPVATLLIRSFFSRVCHQDPARSFMIEGSPVAVCVRCLGIYLGTAMGALLRLRRTPAAGLLVVALLLNLFDVAAAMLHWHGNLTLMPGSGWDCCSEWERERFFLLRRMLSQASSCGSRVGRLTGCEPLGSRCENSEGRAPSSQCAYRRAFLTNFRSFARLHDAMKWLPAKARTR